MYSHPKKLRVLVVTSLSERTLLEPRVSVSLWPAISYVVSISRRFTSAKRNLQALRST